MSEPKELGMECEQCDSKFAEESGLVEHNKLHEQKTSKPILECNKCEKKYGEIKKLRRHDWRSHRGIECTICTEKLASREEIKSHRQTKHQMSV